MRAHREPMENTQFQIAPMVDVIFVLILFFMCSAGTAVVEMELGIKLPGRMQQSTTVPMIDEQMVQVEANGQVILNDQKYDSPADKKMAAPVKTLQRFKKSSQDSNIPALITIVSHPDARYERVIDVLNACAAAKISSVTFTTSEG